MAAKRALPGEGPMRPHTILWTAVADNRPGPTVLAGSE